MRFARLVLLIAIAAPTRAAELGHRFYVTPEEVRHYDSRKLAEILVERIHQECDLAGPPVAGEKVLDDDARLIMMIPSRFADSMLYSGFLNQHQTQTTGGDHRESDRYEAEQELAMLRLPLGGNALQLLPKYAVIDINKSDMGTYRLPTQYGTIAVVFKGEVWKRATWTYADSLDFSQKSGRFDAGGPGNPVLPHTFQYIRKAGDHNRCGNYCEAQIWGRLDVRDINYVMIQSSEPTPTGFAMRDIPVFDYVVTASSGLVIDSSHTAQYVRGALRPRGSQQLLSDVVDYQEIPDEKFIARIEALPSQSDRTGGFSERDRMIAALAMRPKSAVILGALKRMFVTSDDQTRELILYGLSEVRWADFKPRLLESLDAAPGPLLISAIAFAADHRDDPDVAARLERLKRAPESVATEWLERLDKKRLCAPR